LTKPTRLARFDQGAPILSPLASVIFQAPAPTGSGLDDGHKRAVVRWIWKDDRMYRDESSGWLSR
jgi:hypothetical protein